MESTSKRNFISRYLTGTKSGVFIKQTTYLGSPLHILPAAGALHVSQNLRDPHFVGEKGEQNPSEICTNSEIFVYEIS